PAGPQLSDPPEPAARGPKSSTPATPPPAPWRFTGGWFRGGPTGRAEGRSKPPPRTRPPDAGTEAASCPHRRRAPHARAPAAATDRPAPSAARDRDGWPPRRGPERTRRSSW